MKTLTHIKGFKPCTFARYWEMLEILPPALMMDRGFLVGEPWRHDEHGRPMFAAFVSFGDPFNRDGVSTYYESEGPMTVADFRALCAVLR